MGFAQLMTELINLLSTVPRVVEQRDDVVMNEDMLGGLFGGTLTPVDEASEERDDFPEGLTSDSRRRCG
jgi:hypothetical protein